MLLPSDEDIKRKKKIKGVLIVSKFTGDDRIDLIRTVRKWMNKSLMESKNLVDSAPFIIKIKEKSYSYITSSRDELSGKWDATISSLLNGLQEN